LKESISLVATSTLLIISSNGILFGVMENFKRFWRSDSDALSKKEVREIYDRGRMRVLIAIWSGDF